MSYVRPRGDITTILDLTDRDAQDNTYFPLDTEGSWFHTEEKKTYPTAVSIQEFPQRGPAQWGGRMSFEIGSLAAMGDLLQSVMLQVKLGHWYNPRVLYQLYRGELTTDVDPGLGYVEEYWTFCNSLGTCLIEYADFIVNEQRVERITGEWIRVWLTLNAERGTLVGVSSDAVGSVPFTSLAPTGPGGGAGGAGTAFDARRPYPVEDGVYYCLLPFFFLRTRLAETFPLLSCHEGSVRIDIKLRSFEDMVRRVLGWRRSCGDVPLGKVVSLVTTASAPGGAGAVVTSETATVAPEFRDFRIVTTCVLLSASLRQKFLRQPFEQMVKTVQIFSFEEPLKYLVSKGNGMAGDVVEIQLPLELNHPVVELVWVLRRKGVRMNNEWANFTPVLEREASWGKVYPSWLERGVVRVNGQEIVAAEGDWFREHIAGVHQGGYTAYQAGVYGYSFSRAPESHQPSGSANMSRASSVSLGLRVRTPLAPVVSPLPAGAVFDPEVVGGWEVFVFAVHYQWLRFQNGLCSRLFAD
jgi:hypothetical protein